MNRGGSLDRHVAESDPDIVVVGVGPHVHPPANATAEDGVTFEGLIEEVLGTIDELRGERPGTVFGFKTLQPGGCGAEIVSPDDPLAAAAEMTSRVNQSYNYA